MLNKEQYAKEILDIVCETGSSPAIINNAPIKCDDAQCSECKLYGCHSCAIGFTKWANSEYKEREIDWTKVPVDTPVYVREFSDEQWKKRHFHKFDKNSKLYYCYCDRQTSWTSEEDDLSWKQCKLAEGVDYSEWYKN